MKHTIAIAALVATTIGAAGLPAAAQDTTAVHDRTSRESHRTIQRGARPDLGRELGPLSIICSDRGAEALEIFFVRMSYRLDLTEEQSTLFDTLRENALISQTSFADECRAAMPARSADPIERLKAGLRIEEARIAALNGVLPDLEAFYTSLSDEQKAGVTPRTRADRADRANRTERAAPADRPDRAAPADRTQRETRPPRADRSTREPAPGR